MASLYWAWWSAILAPRGLTVGWLSRHRALRHRADPGKLIAAQDDFAKALPLLERALAIREKALGPEHPDTVTLRNDLAIRCAQ
jgi:hypothetical protein